MGTLLNAASAVIAWALGGPFWGAIVFLTFAIVRLTLEAQGLRDENVSLRRMLAEQERVYSAEETDEPPLSGTRLGPADARGRARLASQS